MNWGIRITLLYLGFVAIILTLVFTSYANETELESKDYYARELKFQDQIDAERNLAQLTQPIAYKVTGQGVELTLPKEIVAPDLRGTVFFMRPSDSSKDKTVLLATNQDGVQLLSPGLDKGVYKMQISLKSGGKNYYKEAVINFN